ncbi:MAG: ABC transporter permease [Bacteroidota bacterium]
MNKIFLIIKREYLSRVRKKSFIVMTILAPMLVVFFYGLIFYFALNKDIGESQKKIYVSDETGTFVGKLHNTKLYEFTFGTATSNEAKNIIEEDHFYAVLIIPKNDPSNNKIELFYKEQPGIGTINYIENQLQQEIKNIKLTAYNINPKVIDDINNTKVSIASVKITSAGLESSDSMVSTAIGFAGAFLIYMFIFLYGVQIMQGVIEEKTNRIVEVLISSVKPFELMMGKIIGIAMVGLTQFVIWLLLILIFGASTSGLIISNLHLGAESAQTIHQNSAQSGNDISSFIFALQHVNYVLILGMFLFYFIGGYLFYGALFAAVGSAIDNETDKQQFMLPITLPLVFGFVLAQSAVTANPNSSLAFWLSIIPFTSPVTMMVRLPFGVPTWEIILSIICMIAGFIFTVWMASRIYRIGILMYGKKPTYKEIGKWIFYKN